ncbi:hypothetical protein [uncultured Sneathiella sp.]|uniref:hypothetical protein n=1 Tax=uncultured Sneathiella sp. TaxID=879315 RepID=UPI0030EC237A
MRRQIGLSRYTRTVICFLGILLTQIACAQSGGSSIRPSGEDAMVIAHWNVVAFQAIDGPFQFGIVAFHINGVDRVDYQINGGDVLSVTDMTLNKRTNTYEYWTTIDPAKIGPLNPENPIVEIKATVFPKTAGIPREMDPMYFNVKPADGSQDAIVWVSGKGDDKRGDGTKENPFRQPGRALEALEDIEDDRDEAVFGVVYLMEGEYIWGSSGYSAPDTDSRWVEIAAAPGVDKSKAVFNEDDGGGFLPLLLKVKGVTIKNVYFIPEGGEYSNLWLEDSDMIGPGATTGGGFYHSPSWDEVFFINVHLSDFPNGATDLAIARNVKLTNIGSDAFSGSRLIVNSEVNGIDRGDTQFHPDVFQIYCGNDDMENFIIFGLVARDAEAQGIFAGGCSSLDNVAIVNALLIRPLFSRVPFFSQWHVPSNHLIFSGITMPNSTFLWRNNEVRNVLIDSSVFYAMGAPFKGYGFDDDAIAYQNTHLLRPRDGSMPVDGIDITSGDAGFLDEGKGDFTPSGKSGLRGRVKAPFSNVDVYGNPRKGPSTIGAIE